MKQREYKVRFTFTSTTAYGDNWHRTVTIKAASPTAAENLAWMQRVSLFGAAGNDNAVDCQVVS